MTTPEQTNMPRKEPLGCGHEYRDVAQVSNLLYRGFLIRNRHNAQKCCRGENRGLGNDKPWVAQVRLTRGYARFMQGYARQSAVKRSKGRFEPFRVTVPDLHQIA